MTTAPTTPPAVAASLSGVGGQLATIDAQVAAALGVTVNTGVLPGLDAHIAALHSTLQQWQTSSRAMVVQGLTLALGTNDAVLAKWPTVPADDNAALLAFAGDLKASVAGSLQVLTKVAGTIAPLRQSVDQSVGALSADEQSLDSLLSTQEQAAEELSEQIDEDNEEIEEYNENPWQFLMQYGFDVSAVMTAVADLLSTFSNEKGSIDTLQGVLDSIGQLTNANGALSGISGDLNALSAALLNVQTALSEVDNTLSDIVQTPPLPPILSAQLAAMVTDLQAADVAVTELTSAH